VISGKMIPFGMKIVATIRIVANTIIRQCDASRSNSGRNVKITAPSAGPTSVPLPPRITMISMIVTYEKLKRSGLTKPT
jgi:hypothetical protein